MFLTYDWKDAFYEEASDQPNVFDLRGEESGHTKRANFDAVGRFFVERLKQVFAAVSKNPLPLPNSKGVPLCLLCFAASNPKGAKPALVVVC